ncbi:MAG: PQQ-dependent dehydrogenase, methanol/ethanol family [Emcibacter sp.]|nr:PQQ-dependent dehydrogenase, methanol/ethanol family [Emcibacter sp.]
MIKKYSVGFLTTILALFVGFFSISGCSESKEAVKVAEVVEDDGADWPSFGRTYKEDHYSPLTEINDQNLDRLGLAWSFDLPVSQSGISAPLAIDGVLYFAVGHSVIHAMEATTGKLLWEYDPKVFDVAGKKMRAGWGVRGIAYSKGKIFTATLDGRLIALEAATGKLIWSAMTVDPEDGRYITGAPWIMKDKVIIGHGGADYAPIRGYVTAYDENTGEQAWRFYTVPGNPADGFENDAMEMAAKTWNGEWWKFGGGGTVWNAMTYDAEYNRIYIGTGNGAPWNQKIRSPEGGDNLFLCSVVALDADTGEYVWHYQINPGETWDFNAAMDMQLTDLTIDGQRRSVLMTAPKNGFFYVIDRKDGKLISAEKFAKANWAERIDLETGRPVENPAARYPVGTAYLMFPSAWGAHGVEPMSYNPNTGLVYLPARDLGNLYANASDLKNWDFKPDMVLNVGLGAAPKGQGQKVPPGKGWLAAWNPVEQKEVWRVDMGLKTHNGGTMTTAGNLVVQGQATGELSIYTADTGKKIWSFDAQNGIMAQPITYLADGKQYISLLVGSRASSHKGNGKPWNYYTQKRRLLTFALDAKAELPPVEEIDLPILDDAEFVVDDEKALLGVKVFHRNCFVCHGARLNSGGAAPDLIRSLIPTDIDLLVEVLNEGSQRENGMPQFEEMPMSEIEGLQHYIRKTARQRLKSKN